MQRILLLSISLVLLATAAQGSDPRLEHGPPWLGRDLTLSLTGAPPFAAVRMFESDGAASHATPYGLLELDRDTLRVVASGTTDASGRLDVFLAIPLDPALAETEVHYQALVTDPGAPNGAVLSEARHLRRLGPRLYAGAHGAPESWPSGPEPGGLELFSAVTRELVWTVEYGVPTAYEPAYDGAAQPVFTESFSRGAVMAPQRELLFFDPFFGGVIAAVPFPGATRGLALTSAASVVVVLEPGVGPGGAPVQPARLVALDLESGVQLGSLTLPRSSTGQWSWNPARDEAYVVELDSLGGRKFVRRVALEGLLDLGATAVGGVGPHQVTGIASIDSSVYVATFDWSECIHGIADGLLTRIDYSHQPAQVESQWSGVSHTHLRPIPELGTLFTTAGMLPCYAPWSKLSRRRMGSVAPSSYVDLPVDFADGFPNDLAWDDGKLWVTVPRTYDGLQALLWLDLATEAWTVHFMYPSGPPPQVEVLRDALVHTGALIGAQFAPPPDYMAPRLIFVDPVTGAFDYVPARYGGESLLGIALP